MRKNEKTEEKKSRLPKILAAAAAVIVVIIVLVLILSKCGGGTEPEETGTEQPTGTAVETPVSEPESDDADWTSTTQVVTEQPTETAVETSVSDPEIDDAVWTSTASGSGLPFELRIKPGTGFSFEERENYSCTLASEDGKTVRIDLSGLYYETDLDQLIGFFKSKNPEMVSVGKTSTTVVVKYDSDKTEIVWKVTDTDCLSVTGSDADTIDGFMRGCTYSLGGEEYSPAELTDEFEER